MYLLMMHILQHIYLGVVTTNPAKHLYERQGFTVTSEESCCGCLRCAAGIRVSTVITIKKTVQPL